MPHGPERISKVNKGFFFFFYFGKSGHPKKNWASSIGYCLTQRANQVGPNLAKFFQANKIRAQPGPNFGLVGLAQRAELKLLTLFLPSSLVIIYDNSRILILFKRIKSLYFLFNYFKIHLFCQKLVTIH